MPFVDLAGAEVLPRLKYNVFSDEQLRIIDKGIVGIDADLKYRAAELALREVWEQVVPCVSDRGAADRRVAEVAGCWSVRG